MAEIQKPREKEISNEEKIARANKLKKLRELEEQLQIVESDEKKDVLEDLEKKIEDKIAQAVKGQELSVEESKEIEKELLSLEEEIKTELKDELIILSPYEKLLGLHDWLEKPNYAFMYSIPKESRDKESWQEEWSQVLLDYASVSETHILYMNNLTVNMPFSKFHDRLKALLILADVLVKKKLAAYYGKSKKERKKKEQIRVYWRSNEEWTARIIQWAHENVIMDILLNVEVPLIEEDFARLPEEDLKDIFQEIERQQKGSYVDLGNGQFGIKFKF